MGPALSIAGPGIGVRNDSEHQLKAELRLACHVAETTASDERSDLPGGPDPRVSIGRMGGICVIDRSGAEH
jgi:hypothetical protein